MHCNALIDINRYIQWRAREREVIGKEPYYRRPRTHKHSPHKKLIT